MTEYKKYTVCKMEAFGCRGGVVYKTGEDVFNAGAIIKLIRMPNYIQLSDIKKTWECYDDKEEAVRSLEEWVNVDTKYTVFKFEKTISKKRMGFVHCGDVYSYSRVIASYLCRIGEAPTVLRKDYVNIKDIEKYDSKEEAERSLNDFLNENEPE